MARQTQAQKIEEHNEEQALAYFKATLAQLPDPRRAQGVRYPLLLVVVTALMAMLCGSDDAEAMEAWSLANKDWLATFLPTPHGTPTQDVYLAVLGALDPDPFGSVLRSWAALLTLRMQLTDKHIALDGKTSRHSFDTGSGRRAIHTVSAFLSEAGLVLAQYKTEEKSNEITAIPEVLALLDISGATITIDAMGCQTEIAKQIREGEGHYLLAVKDNQETLHKEIIETFQEAADERMRAFDEEPRPEVEVFEDVDGGHGRVETRRMSICRQLAWVGTASRWKDLSFVVKVERERTVLTSGKTSCETAYYIGSDPDASAQQTAHNIRRHWGIENNLHWVLDMAFREDEARHRSRNTAQNMTILRHFALNIIKQDPNRKLGVANSRKRAGWDRNYLIRLLSTART
jgi:predicted transposase YbfD/YdcC